MTVTWIPGPGATGGPDTAIGDSLPNVIEGLGGDDSLFGEGNVHNF